MNSQRLPGKVLREIEGKPLLEYLLERLERCTRLDAIVVATSTDPGDDPIAAVCEQRSTACYRGALDDVAGRFLGAIDAHAFDAFVRVSGDSPLLDQRLVDQAVDQLADHDLVTNVFPRTFPPGQSVEVVRSDVFRATYGRIREPEDIEHVTSFFYRHADEFAICAFAAGRTLPPIQLTVDTEEQLRAVATIIGRMERPHWEYALADVLELASAT
jgi:spore coat polysaccharide biosynthesis protein SpsF